MDLDSSPHHAATGNGNSTTHKALAFEYVLVANPRGFHLATHFEDIVGANA